MSEIELTGLRKVFEGGVRAVDGIDLTVADGEFFALLGPSGCGKTTLLRTVAGLESADGGTIAIGGDDVTRLSPGDRDVAMVFQDYALFPHMSVVENIAYPQRVKRVPKAERQAAAAAVGADLELAGLMDRRPGQLSGGQQQRVALARAVAARPRVFLFDEPLSNLDARLRLSARTFLKRLQRELAVTTVFVTHDQAEALALADRIAVMEAGRIRQVGTPQEVFRRPANTFVANFIGSTPMNLLPGVAVEGGVTVAGVRLPAAHSVAAGTELVVGFRPEYATASAEDLPGALPGRVAIVEHLGTSLLLTLESGDLAVGVTVPEDAEPAPGTSLWVQPRPDRLLLYDAGGGDIIEA
ncbi:MAG: ATP-binding cassette domain-containing protein [Streptosporangiales bacterium]|nr:ATP-binding cassette domain-containing protein [Streptosporangiales bacterium]